MRVTETIFRLEVVPEEEKIEGLEQGYEADDDKTETNVRLETQSSTSETLENEKEKDEHKAESKSSKRCWLGNWIRDKHRKLSGYGTGMF
jgi:hypothetical protein